jgi:hypothetical protein
MYLPGFFFGLFRRFAYGHAQGHSLHLRGDQVNGGSPKHIRSTIVTGTGLEEGLDNLVIPIPRRHHEVGPAIGGDSIRIGAAMEQSPDHGGVVARTSNKGRRLTIHIANFYLGSLVQEDLHHVWILDTHTFVEGGPFSHEAWLRGIFRDGRSVIYLPIQYPLCLGQARDRVPVVGLDSGEEGKACLASAIGLVRRPIVLLTGRAAILDVLTDAAGFQLGRFGIRVAALASCRHGYRPTVAGF